MRMTETEIAAIRKAIRDNNIISCVTSSGHACTACPFMDHLWDFLPDIVRPEIMAALEQRKGEEPEDAPASENEEFRQLVQILDEEEERRAAEHTTVYLLKNWKTFPAEFKKDITDLVKKGE